MSEVSELPEGGFEVVAEEIYEAKPTHGSGMFFVFVVLSTVLCTISNAVIYILFNLKSSLTGLTKSGGPKKVGGRIGKIALSSIPYRRSSLPLGVQILQMVVNIIIMAIIFDKLFISSIRRNLRTNLFEQLLSPLGNISPLMLSSNFADKGAFFSRIFINIYGFISLAIVVKRVGKKI